MCDTERQCGTRKYITHLSATWDNKSRDRLGSPGLQLPFYKGVARENLSEKVPVRGNPKKDREPGF